MGKMIDLTGQRFGRWTVLEYVGYEKGVMWRCKCDCGTERNVRSDHLRYGKTISCGCFRAEVTAKETGKKIQKHGMWNTRLYHIWQRMKQRCSPSCPKHEIHNYYDKGIRVCAEWESGFELFMNWALCNGYKENLSIDRIDGNKNYEPSNCRWATAREQTNNRRNSYFVEYKGKTKALTDWADVLKIAPSTLSNRLRRGMSVEDAFERPVKKK